MQLTDLHCEKYVEYSASHAGYEQREHIHFLKFKLIDTRLTNIIHGLLSGFYTQVAMRKFQNILF